MKKSIDEMDPDCRMDISVVLDVVSDAYGLSPDIITSRSRNKEPIMARSVCFGFMVSLKKRYSFADIGAPFGKDHSAVIHATKEHVNLYQTNKYYRQKFDDISLKAKKALSGTSKNQVHDLLQRIERTIEGLEDIKKMLLKYYFDGTPVPDSIKNIIDESFPEHDERRIIEQAIATGIRIGQVD